MNRRPPKSNQDRRSAASEVYKRQTENRLASSGAPTAQTRHFDGTIGPHRGFEHLEFATHGAAGWLHYSQWIGANHPEAAQMFYAVLDSDLEVNSAGFGDTGGPPVSYTHLRAHETVLDLVCRLLLEKKNH